jgi:Mrp family chromosome partitioning ATPase
MGRMLDSLKNREAGRQALADTKEPPRPTAAEVVNEWSLREDEIPFIEVGPNRSLIGSAQVVPTIEPVITKAVPVEQLRAELAQRPPVQPPHISNELAIAQTLPQLSIPVPSMQSAFASVLEPRPVSVSFEPLVGLGEPGRVSREIVAFHQPESAISLQYQMLIEKLLQDDAGKVLLLSGVRPSVGTSTVLLNLAIAAAQRLQKRVAVVETQRRRPSLALKLGLKPLAFIDDVLSGAISIEQALIKSPIPKLALLAVAASHPEALLAVEGLTWLLAWLKSRNDLVLIDGPSYDEQNDLGTIAPLTDAMFLVMPQGEPATEHRTILHTITRLGGRLRGLLHTALAG